MRKLIFTILLALYCGTAWGATYYVRADGTAAWNMTNGYATAGASMSLATFQSAVSSVKFTDSDVILFSGRGGIFYPVSAVFMPGAATTAITIGSDPDSQAVFDGQGNGSTAVGIGPLVYISSVAGHKTNLSGIKMQNWKYNTWGLTIQNAVATVNQTDFVGLNGQTAIEVIGSSTVEINDIVNFGGTYTTHWIGVHDASVVTINRCSGIGGQVNAVHSIGTSSVTVNNCAVTSPATGGTSAFLLQGTGVNTINNTDVVITRPAYAAFNNATDTSTGQPSSVTINNSTVTMIGGTIDGSSVAFDTNYYAPSGTGTLVANNCTVHGSVANKGVASRSNEGGLGTSSVTLNNCIFVNMAYAARVSAGGVITHNNCMSYLSGGKSGVGTWVNNNPVVANPQFVDTTACNYHLLPTSPAIGSGSNTPWTGVASATDPDGHPITDHDGGVLSRWIGGVEKSAVDIGAYQYPSDALSIGPNGATGGYFNAGHPYAWLLPDSPSGYAILASGDQDRQFSLTMTGYQKARVKVRLTDGIGTQLEKNIPVGMSGGGSSGFGW